MVFAAFNSISVLVDKRCHVVLNTFNPQTHGELAKKLESTIFSGNQDLSDSNLKLEALFLDKPIEAHFDHVTAVKLRLVAEAILRLSRAQQANMGLDMAFLAQVRAMLDSLMQVPRTCMSELTQLLLDYQPLEILRFISLNREQVHAALKKTDFFVRSE